MKNSWQIGATLMLAALAASPLSFAQTAPSAHSANIAVQIAPYLGVGIMDVDSGRARILKLKEEHGAEITKVDPSSPAGKAGVKVGDVVLEYNGQTVQNSAQLQQLVRETAPGRQVKLSVWRNGAAVILIATIESRRMVMIEGEPWYAVEPATPQAPAMAPMPSMPPMPNLDFDIPHVQTVMRNSTLGVFGEALGDEQQFAEFFGVRDGILVKAVDSNSPADRAGIKVGDVIVKVADTRVGSLRELAVALRTSHSRGSYTVTVVRNKKETSITVTSDSHGG